MSYVVCRVCVFAVCFVYCVYLSVSYLIACFLLSRPKGRGDRRGADEVTLSWMVTLRNYGRQGMVYVGD